MEQTNLSNLKNKLSAYMRKVRSGETVIVLDRGRPIARIERIGGPAAMDQCVARLEAAGLVSRPSKPLPLKLLAATRPRSRDSVVAALIEERREGR
jgi:antitoxin (DNA-binding transcriptional repressor) of toxin-antitoxin stability system